jgi:hypothetical protein
VFSFDKKHKKNVGKMPNLRDDHLPPVGHLTPVSPIFEFVAQFLLFDILLFQYREQ